jgi:aromatic ring-cleaving dioxygenase
MRVSSLCSSLVLCVVVAVLLASVVTSHPTRYSQKQLAMAQADSGAPGILSWHVHILYMLNEPSSVKAAMALRRRAQDEFSAYLGADCDGRYDYARLCMITDHDLFNDTLSGGPFVSGEWSIFVPVPYFSLVVPWFALNHGNLSLLTHPNTGFEYEDHSDYAQWAGMVWPINLAIFEQGVQTNEFDQTVGDAGNPVAMPQGTLCGAHHNTTVLCMPGTACKCDNKDQLCICK